MTYRLIYDDQYFRTIPAVLKEARASIPQLKNQLGFPIKAYTDSQVALVTPNVISYKIESDDFGNLAGYVTLEVETTNLGVSMQQLVLRPAFQQFLNEISTEIVNFITVSAWKADYLT